MSEHGSIKPVAGSESTDFTAHQLTVFRSVAHYLSYTKAAEVLYLSQPAVSQQVKTLELMLGLRLFARSGRGIVLTPAGQELLRHAERLLAMLAETAPVVQEIRTLERGSVVIGASISAGTYVVPPLLGSFHTRYPRIHVTLLVAHRRTVEEDLLAHKIDLGVISFIEQRERFAVELLRPYELLMVAPPFHRLAGRSAIPLHDLQDETLLMREKESVTRLATELQFAQAGVPIPASLELGNIEATKEGVAAELGIAVLPRESVALELAGGDLVVLDVQGFPLQRQWYIVHVKGRRLSLAANALRQLLLQ
ncbi:MAG TPA: LysR substrate-binding domain-containing protein [Ktedonobacteraceae bacterium]|nr:LysR substrate-binding domain-containing protein [Ktedonobacteraceae bacterium]